MAETIGKLPIRTSASARAVRATARPPRIVVPDLRMPDPDPATSAGDPWAPATHDHDGGRGNDTAPADDVLPQRRRRRPRPDTGAAVPAARPVPEQAQPPARTPEDSAAALGALQSGTAAARSTADPEGNDPR